MRFRGSRISSVNDNNREERTKSRERRRRTLCNATNHYTRCCTRRCIIFGTTAATSVATIADIVVVVVVNVNVNVVIVARQENARAFVRLHGWRRCDAYVCVCVLYAGQ